MSTQLVRNFLGGAFNQDWIYEAETDEQVVVAYLASGISLPSIESLAKELIAIAKDHESELDEDWLLLQYSCYYSPNDDGLTGSEWLRRIAQLLQSHLPA